MNELDEIGPIATTDQFRAALLATRDWYGISPSQLRMLQMQCRAPESTMSPSQLAEHLNLKNCAAARLQYATFARAIADRLGYAPPATGAKNAPRWWLTLSTGRAAAHDAKDADAEWIMRPELVAALRSMKWA